MVITDDDDMMIYSLVFCHLLVAIIRGTEDGGPVKWPFYLRVLRLLHHVEGHLGVPTVPYLHVPGRVSLLLNSSFSSISYKISGD